MSVSQLDSQHRFYMQRCLQLASLGAGMVAPNPMVGAVLVYQGRIIGEGYHEVYGQSHAEVNCLQSVSAEDRVLIPASTLYVSLEPCAHFGKTPPCADLIIAEKIPAVVVACRDPFKDVNGKGLEKLEMAGVQVTMGICEPEAKELNKRFFTFHTRHRPYIVLKWAQSADGKMASSQTERIYISGPLSNRLVHQWRSQEDAILVGTNTALHDDPALTNRLWSGHHPVRIVIDRHLRLPAHLKLFDKSEATMVFNLHKQDFSGLIQYHKLNEVDSVVQQMMQALYERHIMSVLVEGGAETLQSFLNEGFWDEVRIITNKTMVTGEGLQAPVLNGGTVEKTFTLGSDDIVIIRNNPQ